MEFFVILAVYVVLDEGLVVVCDWYVGFVEYCIRLVGGFGDWFYLGFGIGYV